MSQPPNTGTLGNMGGVQWSREDVTIVIGGSSPAPPAQSRLIPCPLPKSQRSQLCLPLCACDAGVCRVSRFPRKEFPRMHRVFDSAASMGGLRLSSLMMLPSPCQNKVGTPKD